MDIQVFLTKKGCDSLLGTPSIISLNRKYILSTLWQMTIELDNLAVEIISGLAISVFNRSRSDVAKLADLPVAYTDQFGMLDVAHYLNKKAVVVQPSVGHSTDDVNFVNPIMIRGSSLLVFYHPRRASIIGPKKLRLGLMVRSIQNLGKKILE